MITAIAGAIGAVGLATVAGYNTMSPTSQLYGRTFIGVPRDSRMLALTYDDGPNDPWTWRLLETLERSGVKATFFLIGRFAQQKPEIVRAVASAGHVIGNHTWDHPNLIFASRAEVRRQIEQTQRVVFDICGVETTLFRPPFGGRRPATLRTIRELGLQTIQWNVTCYDWKPTTPARVVAHAERQIRGGNVILLHDGSHVAMGVDRSHSVRATEMMIERYSASGYRFVTIPEMLAQSNRGLVPTPAG